MYHVHLTFQCVYGYSDERSDMGMERMVVRFLEEGREWSLPVFGMQVTWFCVLSWKKT